MILRLLKYLFLVLIGLYILLCGFLYFFQSQLLFLPSTPYIPHYEKISNNPALKNIKLDTFDGYTLDGWIQIDKNKTYTILYFGGNGDDTSYFVEKYGYKNANIISFNYRGYAYSTGKPSQKSLFSDAILQYEYLTQTLHIDPANIIVMGRSLGTGVATYLASQRDVKSVILITPYDSVESVAKELYFFAPVSLLLKNKFPSIEYAGIKSNKLLCIYGGRDMAIPNHHTEALLRFWKGDTKKLFISDATHDNIYTFSEVENAINTFISQK